MLKANIISVTNQFDLLSKLVNKHEVFKFVDNTHESCISVPDTSLVSYVFVDCNTPLPLIKEAARGLDPERSSIVILKNRADLLAFRLKDLPLKAHAIEAKKRSIRQWLEVNADLLDPKPVEVEQRGFTKSWQPMDDSPVQKRLLRPINLMVNISHGYTIDYDAIKEELAKRGFTANIVEVWFSKRHWERKIVSGKFDHSLEIVGLLHNSADPVIYGIEMGTNQRYLALYDIVKSVTGARNGKHPLQPQRGAMETHQGNHRYGHSRNH